MLRYSIPTTFPSRYTPYVQLYVSILPILIDLMIGDTNRTHKRKSKLQTEVDRNMNGKSFHLCQTWLDFSFI